MSEGLYDEDGIDGPFERRMDQAMKEDELKATVAVYCSHETCWKRSFPHAHQKASR